MVKTKFWQDILPPLAICLAFIFCSAVGMLLSVDAFYKFFSPHPGVYDTDRYQLIALKGYYSTDSVAFYPLWPFMARFLFASWPGDMTYYLSRFSSFLFFVSIPLLYQTFKQALNPRPAFMLVLAFALNPMSIFHVIGYTESLFSLLSAGLFWLLMEKEKLGKLKAIALFITTFLMSLTRPALLMLLFGALAAYITIIFFAAVQNRAAKLLDIFRQHLEVLKTTGIIWMGAIAGYSLYGFYCLQARGNFFAPFDAQKYWWNKRLGIHWPQLYNHLGHFIWDILAVHIPIWLLLFALYFVYFKVSQKQLSPKLWFLKNMYASFSDRAENLSSNYLFWFCLYFTIPFPIIVLFTQDHLGSLGRLVFAVPFIFLAVGYFCLYFPSKIIDKVMWGAIALSAIPLIQWWGRYGADMWIG